MTTKDKVVPPINTATGILELSLIATKQLGLQPPLTLAINSLVMHPPLGE